MITRAEFYITCALILVFIAGMSYLGDDHKPVEKRIKIEMQDSVLQVQRDSALALALARDLKADSLQAVINRRNLDIQLIQKKYETKKNTIRVLGPDSSLAFFTRAVTH